MPELDGRVVVITGAAGGIGMALARRFGSAGARLALLDYNLSGVESLAEELGSAGVDALPLQCDVTSFDACQTAVSAVQQHYGGIDVLINNAGITHVSRFADTDPSVLRKVMDVNLFGSVHCTKAALPSLLERKGSVVLLSSVAGFAPLLGRCGYSASKHALHGMFESLRSEEGPNGLHVMMVCPSFTRTGIEDRALGADGGRPTMARLEVGRAATPESVADAIYHGVLGRKRQLVLSPIGKLSYLLSWLAPAFYERGMAKRMQPD